MLGLCLFPLFQMSPLEDILPSSVSDAFDMHFALWAGSSLLLPEAGSPQSTVLMLWVPRPSCAKCLNGPLDLTQRLRRHCFQFMLAAQSFGHLEKLETVPLIG
jgi:hypothetical protein